MIEFIVGAASAVIAIGGSFIVRDLIARPVAPPEHHVCRVCHDRGAFLDAGRAMICPWCPMGRQARARAKNPASAA